ncbi:hypothetical protein BGW80DRAFT_1249882 [Lactifluus volemus]|nr:hypothetical protein BGW80DRAFT_1249882 [Lactifluus volemus]
MCVVNTEAVTPHTPCVVEGVEVAKCSKARMPQVAGRPSGQWWRQQQQRGEMPRATQSKGELGNLVSGARMVATRNRDTVYTVQTAPLRDSGWTRGDGGGDTGGDKASETGECHAIVPITGVRGSDSRYSDACTTLMPLTVKA